MSVFPADFVKIICILERFYKNFFFSRQAQLLAEGQIIKKVAKSSSSSQPGTRATITAPIIKHQSTNRKQSGINI